MRDDQTEAPVSRSLLHSIPDVSDGSLRTTCKTATEREEVCEKPYLNKHDNVAFLNSHQWLKILSLKKNGKKPFGW